MKEQVRVLLRTGSLADALKAKNRLEFLVKASNQPDTNRLFRTFCRGGRKSRSIVAGATTGRVETNNTNIKDSKRTARGYRNPDNYKSVILVRSAVRTAA